jgi:hypothetical protein
LIEQYSTWIHLNNPRFVHYELDKLIVGGNWDGICNIYHFKP